MSDVKLICIYNQFDAFCTIVEQGFNNDFKYLSTFSLDKGTEIINYYTQEYKTNTIYLMGDNQEYLKGIKEALVYDFALNYANQNLNIQIIGEE